MNDLKDGGRIAYTFLGMRKKRSRSAKRRQALNLRAWKNVSHRTCHYCGVGITRTTSTQDHKVALTNGGRDAPDNIVFACKPCNNAKGALPYKEFKAKMLPLKQARLKPRYTAAMEAPTK